MRGELDWIVMKALEKDRRRRYETASDFAADVMRYLADEPVEACPPSAWYRFCEIRPAEPGGVGDGGARRPGPGRGHGGQRLAGRRCEPAEAERASERRSRVWSSTISCATSSARRHRRRPASGTLSTFDLLKITDNNLAERFRKQPLVEASIRLALSRSYDGIGRGVDALRNVERAALLLELALGPAHPETLPVRGQYAFVLTNHAWGNPAAAEAGVPVVAASPRRCPRRPRADTPIRRARADLPFAVPRILRPARGRRGGRDTGRGAGAPEPRPRP